MEFARTVNGDDKINDVGGDAPVHDQLSVSKLHSADFKLATMPSLSREVSQKAIEAYFDRFHWFVMLLHEPLFIPKATSILSKTAWKYDELCDVILVMMVAICGLQCVSNDHTWGGHQILQHQAITANGLIQSLLKEVGVHLYEVMMQSRLEAYQIIMLLEVYHVYFGSLNFARHMAGVPTRVAHGLGLHRDDVQDMEEATYQVGIRCWNHAVIGELFASMIYGQPSSLDPVFSRFRTLSELPGEDSAIPKATMALPIISNSTRPLSNLTFHVLKFELYAVVQDILQHFKVLRVQNAISMEDLVTLIHAVGSAEARLQSWRENLPPVFDPKHWGAQEPWTALQTDDMNCTPEVRSSRRKLALQAIILQVLHDSAVILAHRPLLQCRIPVSNNGYSTTQLPRTPDSLQISSEAALRISRRSISPFKHQLALSFMFMHFFTAGVILCVPPIHLPYSELASEAKTGVLAIISAGRAMSSSNSIARHTDRVLTQLYRKTIQREMDGALRYPVQETISPPPHTQQINHILVEQTPRSTDSVLYVNTPSMHNLTVPAPIPPIVQDNTATFANTSSYPTVRGTMSTGTHSEQFTSPSDQPTFSYLQFGSMNQNENVASYLNEHLDEAFGAFEQMYDLNFMGGLAGDMFGNDNTFPGM